ncbi:helix-turn-helix domain-containing protein [Clostridium tertium]|jgi:AraC-like DNA-binding protein/mannose-6-phosphate isomerase-like protein (cupin superfamily)
MYHFNKLEINKKNLKISNSNMTEVNLPSLMKVRYLQDYFSIHVFTSDNNNNCFIEMYSPKKECIYFSYLDLDNPSSNLSFHKHDYFELAFVLEGQVEMTINDVNSIYSQGEGWIINRKVKHKEIFSRNQAVAYFCISKTFLLDYLKDEDNILNYNFPISDFFKCNLSDEIQEDRNYVKFKNKSKEQDFSDLQNYLMVLLKELVDSEPGSLNIIKGFLLRFLICISDGNTHDNNFIEICDDPKKDLAYDMKIYLDFMKRKISRKELTETFKYNEDYMNRIFKEEYNKTIKNYNQDVYMKESCRLLSKTNLSISDVASKIGFQNRTQFYKVFFDYYNMTPGEFRKKNV